MNTDKTKTDHTRRFWSGFIRVYPRSSVAIHVFWLNALRSLKCPARGSPCEPMIPPEEQELMAADERGSHKDGSHTQILVWFYPRLSAFIRGHSCLMRSVA